MLQLLSLVVCLLAAHVVAAGEVVVKAAPNDGRDDTREFLAAIAACPKKHARLVIPPGKYDLFAGQNPAHANTLLVFDGFEDLTIDGQGAELIFHGRTSCLGFGNCRGVTLRNLSIDWDRPPHSVGTVTAVGDKSFDVQVAPEFPVAGGEPVGAYMDFDPATRLPARHGLDEYGTVESTELIGPQRLRVHLKGPARIKPGVLAVLRHQVYGGTAVAMNRCKDARVENLTVYSVPGMGVVAGVTENVTLDRVRVMLRPGTGRLVSATADATHFGGCKGTVELRDCLFEGMGDDAVNVKSGLYLTVRETLDARTVIAQHNLKMTNLPDPGDAVEFSHVDTLLPYATGVVKSARLLPNDGLHRVEFAAPLPGELKPGDVVGNVSRAPRVRIARCVVGNNRARGMLIQTRDALVENCRFENCTSGGVWVLTEVVHFFESIGTRDVIVRNNTFINCNYGGPMGEGVLMATAYLKDFQYPPRPGVHRRVLFEGNTIRGADNAGIFAAGVDGLTVKGNTIEDVCRMPTRDEGRDAISVRGSTNVRIEGNSVDPRKQGAGFRAALGVGPGVPAGGLSQAGNKGF